jgi:hypothetical protein
VGWETKPSLSVSQNSDRREVLDIIQEFFGCGFMRRDYSDKTLKYEIRSLEELIDKAIPHFNKFPMISGKQKDFVLFAEICKKMQTGEHLTVEGFRKIVQLAYKMNGSGKRKFTESKILSTL